MLSRSGQFELLVKYWSDRENADFEVATTLQSQHVTCGMMSKASGYVWKTSRYSLSLIQDLGRRIRMPEHHFLGHRQYQANRSRNHSSRQVERRLPGSSPFSQGLRSYHWNTISRAGWTLRHCFFIWLCCYRRLLGKASVWTGWEEECFARRSLLHR